MHSSRWVVSLLFFCAAAAADPGGAAHPHAASFSTLITTPLGIEGLTNDGQGNLYTPGRAAAGQPCPVYRVSIANPTLVVVGNVPAPSADDCVLPERPRIRARRPALRDPEQQFDLSLRSER